MQTLPRSRHSSTDVGSTSQPAFEDGFRLLETAHRAEQDAELLERGHERRLAFDRALQPGQRLAVAPRSQQRLAEVGLDAGTAAVLRGLLERRDRLARAVLRQQGDAQEMQRVRVPGIARERIAGQALGVGRMPLLERFHAEPEDVVDRRRRAVAGS